MFFKVLLWMILENYFLSAFRSRKLFSILLKYTRMAQE
tara:strand:- start:5420 stop:5533 length:114 start_codon:yes stop_codon:yes gene_type:complete